MNERQHFARYIGRAQERMASVARIEKPHQTASNGQGAPPITLGHLPDELPTKQHWRDQLRTWWHRLQRQWEPVVVNKSVDSITMPKWIAIGILGAIFTFGIQSWWRASDQRDMLIELKTELRMAKEYEAERTKELKAQAELNKVYIDNMTNQLNTIRGMLSAQQLTILESQKKGNN